MNKRGDYSLEPVLLVETTQRSRMWWNRKLCLWYLRVPEDILSFPFPESEVVFRESQLGKLYIRNRDRSVEFSFWLRGRTVFRWLTIERERGIVWERRKTAVLQPSVTVFHHVQRRYRFVEDEPERTKEPEHRCVAHPRVRKNGT